MAAIGKRVGTGGGNVSGGSSDAVRDGQGAGISTGSGGTLRSRSDEEMAAENAGMSLEQYRDHVANGGRPKRDLLTGFMETHGGPETREGHAEKLAKAEAERREIARQENERAEKARLAAENAELAGRVAKLEQDEKERARLAAIEAAKPVETAKPSAPAAAASHRVAKGENLWKIAKEGKPEGVSQKDYMSAIALANGIKDPSSIRIGRELKLPTSEQVAAYGPEKLKTAGKMFDTKAKVAKVEKNTPAAVAAQTPAVTAVPAVAAAPAPAVGGYVADPAVVANEERLARERDEAKAKAAAPARAQASAVSDGYEESRSHKALSAIAGAGSGMLLGGATLGPVGAMVGAATGFVSGLAASAARSKLAQSSQGTVDRTEVSDADRQASIDLAASGFVDSGASVGRTKAREIPLGQANAENNQAVERLSVGKIKASRDAAAPAQAATKPQGPKTSA